MKRRHFLLGALSLPLVTTAEAALKQLSEDLRPSDTMPVLFVGHGSPMNAITENSFSSAWNRLGNEIPKPQAIICISAHWLTQGSFVSTTPDPQTIHDFRGFPQALFDVQYAAPGQPQLAAEVKRLVEKNTGYDLIGEESDRGLDHGTWSVLKQMYPQADIPVLQLSIDYRRPMEYHYLLAQQLQSLREQGVLIIGSGNIVHNLRRLENRVTGFDWAIEFDQWVKGRLQAKDHKSLIEYKKFGQAAMLSVPTPDHYIPLLYLVGLQRPTDELRFECESIVRGAIAMRTVVLQPTV